MRLPRSLAFGIGLAALVVAAGLDAPALAASATLRGDVMPPGFGRLSLSFDEQVPTRIRVANGVLIVAFGGPVRIDVGKIARELPDYVSVARIDPDGRGMRFALARPYKANLIEAGDKAFIDLLPETWRGMLPGPPPEVINALSERLRLAEARARDIANRPPPPRPALALRSAKLPTLERLLFDTPAETAMTAELAEGKLALSFDRPMTVDAAMLKSSLPARVELLSHDIDQQGTRLLMAVPPDWTFRKFRDEDGLVLDLLPPPRASAPTPADLQEKQEKAAGPSPSPGQPAATAAPSVAKPAQAAAAAQPAPQTIRIEAAPSEKGARLDFRFPRLTGAAAFLDAGVVTLVFDTQDTIDPASLHGVLPRMIEDATVTREGKATLVRLRLASQQLVQLFGDDTTWSLGLGETVAGRSAPPPAAQPLAPSRAIDERGQSILSVPLPGMTGIHWLQAGPAGLPVAVATAFPPAGTVAKPYRFVEFGLPQTAHGVVVVPLADDVVVRAGTDQVRIGRAAGLTLSLDVPEEVDSAKAAKASEAVPLLDPDLWTKLREGSVRDGARALLRHVTDASRSRKSEARLALARFYAANALMSEASGPLKALMADDATMRERRETLFLRGIIASGLYRDQEALDAFDAPAIKDDTETGLWRALSQQRLGRNAQALIGFRRAGTIMDRYPDDLQGRLRTAMARAALAMQDVGTAEREIEQLEALPKGTVDAEELALLRAMLDDAGGRPEAALNGYKPLFEARNRPVAAEAQLRAVKLVQAEKRSDMTPDEAMARLETVSVIWRGGELEIEALAELGRLYADQHKWREAFLSARRANESFPEHPLTRRMHDETAQRFAEIFGGKGGGNLSRIDTLALFYDFKEFLPIGRRGDEITRLLADRLVELDLLDQAAEILRYQIEKRLTGAARSTTAASLAMVSLMNGKPAEAVQTLNATRLVELPQDVRRARLLLEAKALSDLSRTDQALEMLDGERGPEIDRLRADIVWTGKRWREAGEAHERLLGERWRGEGPLDDGARADVMRAAVSYVMADEALSLDRLRSKFATKMAESADARTFAFVTGASRASTADIRQMARAAASADTLGEFMKAYRERYPNYATPVRQKQQPDARPETKPDAPSTETGAATTPPGQAARG